MREDLFEPLIDATVTRMCLSSDNKELTLGLSDGSCLVLGAEGDCCSSSWFNDLCGVSNLLGHRVVSVDAVEMPDCPQSSDYDLVQMYGYRITTTAGYFDIIFRNGSNGYYGGYLELRSLPKTPDGHRFIADDWSADA